MRKITFLILCFCLVKGTSQVAVPTLVSPSNGSTNENVSTTLDWTAVTGNNGYLYEIDTTPLFNSPLYVLGNSAINSSQATVSNLRFGTTYYWRSATKGSSDTSAWTSTWSFTTSDQVTPVSPSNGAINEDVSVTLDWTPITGNNGYIYEIDTTPLFNSSLYTLGNSGINSSQASVSDLRFGTTYYWRAATKTSSDTSMWSTTWSFTTSDQVTPVSPSNGAINEDVSVTLDWTPITGNNGYIYEIDTTPLFNSSLYTLGNSGINSSQADVGDLRFGTTYYWRAAAKNSVDTSMWSATYSFSTSDGITLISPANGLNYSTSAQISFDWSSLSSVGYILEIDTTSQFNSSAKHELTKSVNSGSSYNSVALLYGEEYFWRVKAFNAADTSNWSSIWTFTTGDSVVLVSPANNVSYFTSADIDFDWESVPGAGYILEIDTTLQYNSGLKEVRVRSLNTSSNWNGIDLHYGKKYYWRVKSYNALDTSNWSASWEFTTGDSVTLQLPSNNYQFTTPSLIDFDWATVAGAGHVLEIDTTPVFNSGLKEQFVRGINTFSHWYSVSLRYGTKYYWRVKNYNTVDTSSWSSIWTFTTGADLALAQHVSPTDNSTNEPVTGVVLDWFDVTNAASYEIQVSLDGSFNSNIIVYDTTSLINSNYTINTTLLNNTTYHWRVRSKNQDGYSFWSNPWSFTTIGNTTSIENYNDDLLQVYPVPSSGTINVKVNTNDDYSLKIYSANGKIIINKDNLTASLLNYNLEGFDKGLYFVEVSTLDNTIIKKIILN